jgi:hypothetical protein
MDEAGVVNLLAQLIPLGITLYQKIAANVTGAATIEQVLAQADVNWNGIEATAQQQLGTAPAPASPS